MFAKIFLTLAIGSSLATGAFAQSSAAAAKPSAKPAAEKPTLFNKKCPVMGAEEKKLAATLRVWLKSEIADLADNQIKVGLIDKTKDRFPKLYSELLPLKARAYEVMPFQEMGFGSENTIPLIFFDLRKFNPALADDFRAHMLQRMAYEAHSDNVSAGVFSMQNKKELARYFTERAKNPDALLVLDLAVNYVQIQARTSIGPAETPVKIDDYLGWVKTTYPNLDPPDGVLSQERCERGCDDEVLPTDEEVAKSKTNEEMRENLVRQGYICTMNPFHCDAPTKETLPLLSGDVVQGVWDWGIKQVLDAPLGSFEDFAMAINLLRHAEFLKADDIQNLKLEERANSLARSDLGDLWLHSKGLPDDIANKLNFRQYYTDDHSGSILAEKESDLKEEITACKGDQKCVNAALDGLSSEEPGDELNLMLNTAYQINGSKDLLARAIAFYEDKGPRQPVPVSESMLSEVAAISWAWHQGKCPDALEYYEVLESIKDPELRAYETLELIADLYGTRSYETVPGEELPKDKVGEAKDADEP